MNPSDTNAAAAATKLTQEELDQQFAEQIKAFFANAKDIKWDRAQRWITFTLTGPFKISHGDFCEQRPQLQLGDLSFEPREEGGHTITVREVRFPALRSRE